MKEIKIEEEFILDDFGKKYRINIIKCPEDISGFEVDTLERL